MTKFNAELDFTGGCYECPLCTKEGTRRCLLVQKTVDWRFKVVNLLVEDDQGMFQFPDVKVAFNPHKSRLKNCPLQKK